MRSDHRVLALFTFRRKLILITLVLLGLLTWKVDNELENKGCYPLDSDVVTVPFDAQTNSVVRFIAMGDTGTGNQDQKKVAKAIRQVCHEVGCDFVLLLGDNFYPSGVVSENDPQFKTKFTDIYQAIDQPFIVALGNHDVINHPLPQVLYSQKNPKWVMPNFSYQFQAGPTQFHVINSVCSLWAGFQLIDQIDSTKSSVPWRFVLAHHPIYSSGVHGDTHSVVSWFWQDYLQEKVDFYLSGHDHELEHLQYADDSTDYIISGAGGAHYRSEKERNRTSRSEANSRFVHQDIGFVWFEVDSLKVQMKFFDGQGTAVYDYQKTKNIN